MTSLPSHQWLNPADDRKSLLIFASPHSGREVPPDMGAAPGLALPSLHSACDVGMDQLVSRAVAGGVPVLLGHVSRAYIDLNRAPLELDPELILDCPALPQPSPKTRAGYGVVPRLSGDNQPLYDRKLSLDEVQSRLDGVHTPYHWSLGERMNRIRARYGRAILIDWHSMPHRATGPNGPDVVLGDRYGTSCQASLTRHLCDLFQGLGWRVALNRPYAGGYATQVWGQPDQGFEAIQIELSRRLYWDEARDQPGIGWRRCQTGINRVIAALIDAYGIQPD